MAKDIYLCLHGHFYQPPRENPWIESVELQESAAPFHDWNERIHFECYLPNTRARVLDDKGQIIDIVNNFEKMSFNIGPTLLSWLEEKYPETHEAIVRADRASISAHHGHGNAIAQVYNHMIMPLANERDKVTQVKWGVEDFKYRFGREPESIWLPETACNEETLEVLIAEGIKYVILSPYQAEAVRPLGTADWTDVSSGTIDPKMPYRCFLKSDPSKSIVIFFYDGPVSRAVGFGDIAFDAKRYAEHLQNASSANEQGKQLVHVAVDGETYGHHKAFADRALGYLLNIEAPKRGFRITNYGEFLAMFPPTFEVKIKAGEKGEGTSWSCAHGVRRWKDHCGCRGGGPAEWTQHWRKPLREALDWLRDELFIQFVTIGSEFFNHVWDARNDYIRVILDRSEKNVDHFFTQHAKRPLNPKEKTLALKLLEIQRNAMLMYTSCGWFFTEISGIETVQILQYAARALQLAQQVGADAGSSLHHHLEKEFLRRLAHAKSNIPELKDGRGVYERYVRPSYISYHEVASQYAIESIFEEYPEQARIYCFDLHILHQRKESYGDLTLNFGRIKMRSRITYKEHDVVFIAAQFGTYDFHCSVKPYTNAAEFETMEREFFDGLYSVHLVELIRKIDSSFGESYYSLKDMLPEKRLKIISVLTKEALEKMSNVYETLYEENRKIHELYRTTNLPVPVEIRFTAELTLTRRLQKIINQLAAQDYDLKKSASINRLIEIARSFHAGLDKKEIVDFLSSELNDKCHQLFTQPKEETAVECLNILKIAKKVNVELHNRQAQDSLFALLKKWCDEDRGTHVPAAVREKVNELALQLQINTAVFRKN